MDSDSDSAPILDSAYTPADIDIYLSTIGLPPSYAPRNNPTPDLALLTALYTHQITSMPYENLGMHYSPHKQISTAPPALLAKATARARGGYCIELTILLHHVLRAYGFAVHLAAAKTRLRAGGRPTGHFIGMAHAVNVVVLAGGAGTYALDAAFGGDGPTAPLRLDSDADGVPRVNLGAQEVRLVRGVLPGARRAATQAWMYEYRNGAAQDWSALYAILDGEIDEADAGVLSWFASTKPDLFLQSSVLVSKFVRGPVRQDGAVDIVGKVMLVDDQVKLNEGERTRVVRTCASEAERIDALRDYFGIELTTEEAGAVGDAVRLPRHG